MWESVLQRPTLAALLRLVKSGNVAPAFHWDQ